MRKRVFTNACIAAGCLALGSFALTASAADHIDAPAAVAEPAADITDLYAWMSSDTSKLNLIMNVSPFATSDSSFSSAVQYVFHVNSSAGYGMEQTETRIVCQFLPSQEVECWAGDSYLAGDASDTAGLVSDDGLLRVFTGLRDDPFFMEFTGFTETVKTVVGAAGGLSFDTDGCPSLDSSTGAALRAQLQSGPDNADASDTFAGSNVLSIVVQIDTDSINSGGDLLSVWASTHRSN
jgi:hypothetical protein